MFELKKGFHYFLLKVHSELETLYALSLTPSLNEFERCEYRLHDLALLSRVRLYV